MLEANAVFKGAPRPPADQPVPPPTASPPLATGGSPTLQSQQTTLTGGSSNQPVPSTSSVALATIALPRKQYLGVDVGVGRVNPDQVDSGRIDGRHRGNDVGGDIADETTEASAATPAALAGEVETPRGKRRRGPRKSRTKFKH